MEITIVGGSLTGLTLALACACRGIPSQVLERAVGSPQNCGALGIDRDLLLRTIEVTDPSQLADDPFPPLTARRNASTWQAVHAWLRDRVLRSARISLIEGVSVCGISQDENAATITNTSNQQFPAACIVGADGNRSLLRRAINPGQARGDYAGYLLWRGLVPEADLTNTHPAQREEGVALLNAGGYKLVAYPVAGHGGSLRAGERRISFTWYDAGRTQLLQGLRCLGCDGTVLRSPDPSEIPPAVTSELYDLAGRIWPDPWRSAIRYALSHQSIFATPVEEYSPRHLRQGRLAIIGDAARAVSPVTGKGFASAVADARALAECLARHAGNSGRDVPAGLAAYEKRRLADTNALVDASRKWSRDFVKTGLVASQKNVKEWKMRK